MKRALVGIAFLILLVGTGAAGFFLGFRLQERMLMKSGRNPVKLELKIATLEVENQALTAQVAEMQRQVESGIRGQTEKAAQLADMEGLLKKAQAELDQLKVSQSPPDE